MGQTISHYSSTIIGLYQNDKARELPAASQLKTLLEQAVIRLRYGPSVQAAAQKYNKA